jgi:Domain of unknown function (DUF4337)
MSRVFEKEKEEDVMNSEEIQKIVEQVERARDKKEKPIGTTIAIFAALLAIVTVGSHREHTKEVFAEAEIVDEWSFYTAKHARAHDYGREAEFAALLSNGKDLANQDYKKSIEEQCGVPPGDCQSPVEDADLEKALSAVATPNGSEGAGQPGKPAAKSVALKGEQKESERAADKKKLGAVDLLAQVREHKSLSNMSPMPWTQQWSFLSFRLCCVRYPWWEPPGCFGKSLS